MTLSTHLSEVPCSTKSYWTTDTLTNFMQCDLLRLNRISLTSANIKQTANITHRAAKDSARRIISSAYVKQPK